MKMLASRAIVQEVLGGDLMSQRQTVVTKQKGRSLVSIYNAINANGNSLYSCFVLF
jgi:hypothetical protein